MKKWEVKLMNATQNTDVEAELNAEGQQGWRFAHMLATPFGVKFVLERQLDEEVAVVDVEEAKRQAAEAQELADKAALLKKFGI